MASTIKEFTDDKSSVYGAMHTSAQQAFAQAVDDLGLAQIAYDTLVGAYADLERDIASTRLAMAEALMPADVELLASNLRDFMLQRRNKYGELLASEAERAAVQQDRDLAEQAVTLVSESVNAIAQEQVLADARADRQGQWKQSVADGDLTTLAARAEALLDEVGLGGGGGSGADADDKVSIAAAKARVEGDLPADLLTRARERSAHLIASVAVAEVGLFEALEDELAGHLATMEGAAGLSDQRWQAFERAEMALSDFVLLSASRYQQAVSLLQGVENSTPLTAAEQSRITDTTLSGGDEAALVKEKARDDARAAVDVAAAELEVAIAQARIADVDADPAADANVSTKQANLDGANSTLVTAESEYSQPMRDNLDQWEAAVPDPIWANVVAYDQAIAQLSVIYSGDAGVLETAMDNAEAALVTALEAEDEAQRAAEIVAEALDRAAASSDYLRDAYQRRLISVVRGDNGS